ncbi:hypothetical protein AU15_01150 [Marinobacter salarius]|uniref:Uncharacterized protein n=1 Tax=Marinobacter salarius TaxID=1420917 RepID=W5Z3A1_9GAMM|nr:hypothetical protein AU15_01150 [Marinobacter salarius]
MSFFKRIDVKLRGDLLLLNHLGGVKKYVLIQSYLKV